MCETASELAHGTFSCIGLGVEKVFRGHKAEHGVAEVFKPLVVVVHFGVFITEGGMGERQFEVVFLFETIAHGLLELFEVGFCHEKMFEHP